MTKPPMTPPSNLSAGVDAKDSVAHRESHDAYHGSIVDCHNGWRVIIANTNSQYIVQKRSSSTNTGVWIGKSYCTTRSELLRVCSRLKLLSDANVDAALRTLPSYAHQHSQK